jgi:hypothetical protein
MSVVVDVRLFGVALILVSLAIVMAVCHGGMIVLVRVPVRAMLELIGDAAKPAAMVVRDMVVVVRVHHGRVGVGRRFAFSFGPLFGHRECSLLILLMSTTRLYRYLIACYGDAR